MARNRKNKPDDVKIIAENEAPAQEQTTPIEAAEIANSTPPPEITAEETAVLEHEGEVDLHEIGNDGLEPSTPLDIPTLDDEVISEEQETEEISDSTLSPEVTNEETESPTLDNPTPADEIISEEQEPAFHETSDNGIEKPITFDIPAPGDVVVPFEKINEIISGKRATAEMEQTASEKDSPTEVQTDKAEQEVEDTGQELGKPLDEAEPKGKSHKDKAAEKADKKSSRSAKQEKTSKEDKPAEQEPQETPPSPPEQPQEPKEAPRSTEPEQIVYLKLSELYAFKDHPFQVRNDDEMAAMVESVKDKGVTQPAIVRPREDGGYEIVSGHRRQKASELAGFEDMPCIIRNLTDEQAITQMVEDNTNQREHILPSERAKALQMQLEAIKQQGVRTGNGQRSNEVVAERNKMTVKQVQRYIKLNELVPDLMKMVDEKKIAFTPAVELAFIKPKNQKYIAIAIEGQQSAPSLSQAQRMRDLDQKKLLNPDMIDGIMLEEKKEVDKVIISSQELGQYFSKDKTPREMKDTILKLLDEWKEKQPEIAGSDKKKEPEK